MTDILARNGRMPSPNSMVIFGASGDLAHRKLLPALWNLHMERQLPEGFSVVGVARTPKDSEGFRKEAREAVEQHSRFRNVDDGKWAEFERAISYMAGSYNDPAMYQALDAHLKQLCAERGSCGNHLFYLSTPPTGYEEIVRQLGASGLAKEPGTAWSRIIVEKPFGRDLQSARRLTACIQGVFDEHQVYRIDHYLGKETVQNLMVFRFGNGIFEPIWNRQYVDHVQISVAEELGVEGRGAYYEQAGALRDMIQNHMMQVLCLVAMEAPARADDRAIRNEKVKVLEAVRPLTLEEVPLYTARGQYSAGVVHGKPVPGYLQEEGVSKDSRTETFAAVRLMLDNWRWAGVPFYLRSGKRLPKRLTEISIHFRRAPQLLFRDAGSQGPESNVLTIRIQPDEGMELSFNVKTPGAGMYIQPVTMGFDYCEEFRAEPPEAYERLILDCMLGDITLFSRDDWMDRSWQLMDPILKSWAADPRPLPQYPAGTWGPVAADVLLSRDGNLWRNPA